MKAGIPKGVINILPGSGNEQYLYSLNRLFLVIPSLGKVLKDQRCEHFSPSLCAAFASFYLPGELKLYDHSRKKEHLFVLQPVWIFVTTTFEIAVGRTTHSTCRSVQLTAAHVEDCVIPLGSVT